MVRPGNRAATAQSVGGEEPATTQRSVEMQTSISHTVIPQTARSSEAVDEMQFLPANTDDLTADELDAYIIQAREKRRLKAKRNYIEALRRGEDPLFDSSILEQPVEQQREEREPKRPRREAWGRIQLPTPRFKGKSWSELMTFFNDLRSHFATQPDNFISDNDRVMYASTCLGDEVKRRWTNYLRVDLDDCPEQVSWNEFKEWLETGINDGPTRCLEATKPTRLTQAPHQKFRSFLDQYENIECELPERLPETFRICSFVQRLQPALRKQVLSNGIPATWRNLQQICTISETLLDRERTDSPANPQQRSAPSTSDASGRTGLASAQGGSNNSQTNQYSRAPRWTPTCWKCGGAHLKPACSAPDCSKCSSQHHTTETHDNPISRNNFPPHRNPASGSNNEDVVQRRA